MMQIYDVDHRSCLAFCQWLKSHQCISGIRYLTFTLVPVLPGLTLNVPFVQYNLHRDDITHFSKLF